MKNYILNSGIRLCSVIDGFMKWVALLLLAAFVSGCGGGSTNSISATALTTAQSLTFGTPMVSFSPLTASGGNPPYSYTITSGSLPAGLTLDAATGAVTGTPTAAYTTSNVVFGVTDAKNATASTSSTVGFTVALPTGFVSQGGLTWMPVSMTLYTYAQATTLCSGTISGLTGWRLPVFTELTALYSSGAMNSQGWNLYSTWSSTPGTTGTHKFLDLAINFQNDGPDGNVIDVTCVR